MEQNSAQSDKTNIPIFGNLGGAIPQFSVSQFAANNQNAGGVPSFSGANSEAPAMFGQGMDMDMCSGTASPSVPPQNLNMANPFSTMRGTMEPSLPSMKASVDPPATNSASRMPPDPMSWLEDSAKVRIIRDTFLLIFTNLPSSSPTFSR